MDTTNMPVENAKNREAGSEESPEISRDETGVKTLSLKQKILSRNVVLSILFLISYIGLYFLMFNPNVCVMIEPLDAKTARITKYLYLGLSLVILLLFFFVFKRDVWEKFTITASKPVAIITGVITIGFMDVLFTINSQEALRRGIYTLISAFAIFVICYCIIKAGISIILSFWHDLDKKEKMLFAGICGFGFLLCFIHL